MIAPLAVKRFQWFIWARSNQSRIHTRTTEGSMIRKIVRPSVSRQLIVAMIGILVSANTPRVRAAEISQQEPATRSVVQSSTPAAVDLKALRAQVVELLKSPNPAKVAWGKKLSLYVEIASATTQAERHAAIQKLPVTVVVSPSKDGRAGFIKSFVAG